MPTKSEIKARCKNNLIAYIILLVIAAVLVVLDQISKYLVVLYLPKEEQIRVIPYLFNFTYVENKGAAWGMMANSRWIFIIVSAIAVAVLAVLLLYFAKSKKVFVSSLVLIFAGGIGNMIDRIFNGYVVDFIQLDFFQKFPVFNVADSYVTVGGFMLIIYILFIDRSFLSGKKKDDGREKDDKGNETA